MDISENSYEKSFLGCILMDSSKIIEADLVKPEMFLDTQNQVIYKAILDLYSHNEHIDIVSVYDKLNKQVSPAYISKLCEDVLIVTSGQVEKYSQIIFEKHALRQLYELAEEIKSDNNPDVFELMENIETQIFKISQNAYQKKYKPIRDIVEETLTIIDNAKKHGFSEQRIPTGYIDLDKLLGGFAKTDLIVLAARPSMGKTSLALNIAENISKNKPVAFFSLEMSETQLSGRLISSNSGISSMSLFTGTFHTYNSSRITSAVNSISKLNLYIDDTPALTPIELRSKARKLKMEKDIQFVVVDYLQLMRAKAESREREISTISQSLKNLAKELNIPVLVLSQLNRSLESRNDKRPMLSDLRESGAIEQDADVVMFIYRPAVYGMIRDGQGNDLERVAEIIIGKHRSGATGTVNLIFEKEETKFKNSLIANESMIKNEQREILF